MQKRNFQIEAGAIRSEDDRTVEATISSEFPVRRYDGDEILSHDPGAVDLSRQPLPLITAHDTGSLPVGVVEGLRIVGDKLKGILRISKTQDAIWSDIKDGILRNLSIGYFVRERSKTKGGYIVTKWQPFECSLVAAGADPQAGIGRSINTSIIRKGGSKMDFNDILKAKKRALDELSELAVSESLDEAAEQRFEELKNQVRQYDQRIEAIELAKAGQEDLAKRSAAFKPDPVNSKSRDISFPGGPALDRSYRGMFAQGREIVVDEAEIREFTRAMVEGTGASGGYGVPEVLAAKWLDASLPLEIVRPRATVWPMTSSNLNVPGWDASNQSGGDFFGGFEMEFLSENGLGTAQSGKLRLVSLVAKKGAIFAEASQELVDDGQGFESQLEQAIKKSLGLGLDYHFLRGTGAGAPQGVLNDPALVTVEEETDQAADTINFANASKMFARMYPAGRSKAVWLANETCLPQMLTGLTIPVGTAGGEVVKAFNEQNGTFTLLGRPVIFTPNLPQVGDLGDLLFVDLSQYAIGLRKDLRVEKSAIPGWQNDIMSYRVIVRCDGLGTWNTYLTPRNGDTMSWCVALAERAGG